MDFALIRKNIRYLRIKHQYTRAELAEIIDYDPTTISFWELGHCMPSLKALNALSRAFDIAVGDLLDKDLGGPDFKPEGRRVVHRNGRKK